MMAVMFLSQRLASRIDRPRRPFGAQCVEHAEIMLPEVCLCAPHSQLQDEANPIYTRRTKNAQCQFTSS